MASRWVCGAAAAALALAGMVGLAACGSTTPPVVTPGSHVVTPVGWGVRFAVSDWLSQDDMPPGSEGVLLFKTPDGDHGGGLAVVARLPLPSAFGVASAVSYLSDVDSVRNLLPGGVGAGADVTIVRDAALTEVGPGWAGADAAYRVTLADGKEPLYGQRTFGMEMAVFSHAGHLYEVTLLVSPDGQSGMYRAVFQLTLRTFEDAK
jgi:hypothetical protein